MEFAFKYAIWAFLSHVLIPESQRLAAIWHKNVLNFLRIRDQLHNIYDGKDRDFRCLKGSAVHRFNIIGKCTEPMRHTPNCYKSNKKAVTKYTSHI